MSLQQLLSNYLTRSETVATIKALEVNSVRGVINTASDFPTLAEVNGVDYISVYSIGTNVTDNDASKTNTGQSFTQGQMIVWNKDDTSWVNTAPVAPVSSVNTQVGNVVLDQDDIPDGATYKQYSQTEKTKLAGIETGADVTDAANVAAAGALMSANNLSDLGSASSARTNIGLGNVDNTSDLNKPISTATQTALDAKVSTSTTVNGQALSSNVILDADDIDDNSTTNKFTTASDISKLAGIETGADVTDTANVAAAGALMASNNLSDLTNTASARSNIGLGNVANIKDNYVATANPTTGDDSADGYSVGSKWINTSNDEAFVCVDATEGSAIWSNITGGGGSVENPSYVIPTLTLSANQSGNKEVGVAISVTLTATFTKNDAGAPTSIEILKDGVQIATVSNPTGTNTTNLPSQFSFANANTPNQTFTLEYTDTYTPSSAADVVYTARANYAAGNANKDSDGNDDTRTPAVRQTDAPQAAGTNFTSSAHTITFLYPYFFGVSDAELSAAQVVSAIEAGGGTKVLEGASGDIDVTFGNSTHKYLWLAHFSSYPTKTSWYINDLNNDTIPGTLFGAATVNQAVDIPSGASGVNYTIYDSEYATIPSGLMQFRN